ncbi:MAG: hypothetical protein V1824_02550 [archaeon]
MKKKINSKKKIANKKANAEVTEIKNTKQIAKDEKAVKLFLIISLATVVILALVVLLVIKPINSNASTDSNSTNNNSSDLNITIEKVETADYSNIISKLLLNKSELFLGLKSKISKTDSPQVLLIDNTNFREIAVKYYFLYSEKTLEQYNFKIPENGDYVIIYPKLIIVYNYSSDSIKSIFVIN